MKRKWKMISKCIGLVLAGGLLSCALCSCTSNGEMVDFEHINLTTGESIEQSQSDENESGAQPQSSAAIDNDQTQNSANRSSEQLQSSADISNNQTQDSADENADKTSVLSHKEDASSTVSSKERFKAILLDNANFISTDLQNQELNLTEIKKIITDDEITVKATQFAIIDLDGDGENEIVLWIQINGVSDYGFEILRYQDGDVYGYTLPYREFMNLKTDGTFLFSGGAADFGTGNLKFSGNGYMVDRQIYSESQYDSNNEGNVQYFVNGEGSSKEAFEEAIRHQEEKENVGWHDLSAKSVHSVFD